ncbi:MAG: helix-turn-helix domain-containing protein [Planctomycetes bacterium]|nr:helix-turn-helix domain-containing protein [Planctomycetota bacterium]
MPSVSAARHDPSRIAEAATRARERSGAVRGRAERLVDLARRLPPPDRALIDQLLSRGCGLREIATLTGRPTGAVRRRVRRLLRRLNSPAFVFLDEHAAGLGEPERRTAQLVVFQGLSLRAAATTQGLSLHRVRGHIQRFRALARV